MKNTFATLSLFVFGCICHAQIISITDTNFKNALLNSDCADIDGDGIYEGDADTNDDGEIQLSEAEALLGLFVSVQDISSLDGIENFSNLRTFYCSDNSISSIDVSALSNLEKLYASRNEFVSIDVSQNSSLIYLDLAWNDNLSSLDVTQNINLEGLQIVESELSSIDVTQNLNLTYLSVQITDLTEIDISQNIALEKLSLSYNSMQNIDISQNVNLEELYFIYSSLDILDFSSHPNLRKVTCYGNQLSNLDFSENPNLEELNCRNNPLGNLNLQNGNNSIISHMFATDTPNLLCIQVDDENFANSQVCDYPFPGWCKDETVSYSEECNLGINDLTAFEFTILPNPADEFIKISSDNVIDKVVVYSSQGQMIFETKSHKIDVSNLASGIYFVSITQNGNRIMKRLLKN